MSRNTLAAAVAVALTFSSTGALAQSQDAEQLDQVVVTGTRTAVTVDDSLSAVEVIDRAEIERTQARSLSGPAARPRGHQPRQPGRRRASSPRCSCAAPNPITC